MRSVIRQPDFERSAERIYGNARNADDQLLEHIDWYLARESLAVIEGCASCGRTEDGLVLRVYKSKCGAVVVFHVEGDGKLVILHDVALAQPEPKVVPLKVRGT